MSTTTEIIMKAVLGNKSPGIWDHAKKFRKNTLKFTVKIFKVLNREYN